MNWQKEVEDFKSGLVVDEPKIDARSVTIGFFGSVGGGKSVTAGICAVGITPSGLIGWVDGEGRRSGWAIDIVADMASKRYGGTKEEWSSRFKVVHIDPPFNPLRVVAAIEMLEKANCKTICLDVLTQAWDSDGGYLDMKNEAVDKMSGGDEYKAKRVAAAAAASIKPWTHQKMVNRITNTKTNMVLLFQAKQKFNATASKPNEYESPIQESGLTRTAIAVGAVKADDRGVGGVCSFELPVGQGTKYTHQSILKCLPRNGERFGFEHAEAILKLCGGTPTPSSAPAAKASKQADPLAAFKRELWAITKKVHGENRQLLQQHLWDENYMTPEETLDTLNQERIEQIIVKFKSKNP